MKILKPISFLITTILGFSCMTVSHSVDEKVVDDFELEKYMGKWYEIARYDNYFEKGLSYVTAEYELQDDGRVMVVNSGRKVSGNRTSSRGKARFVDAKNSDKGALEVSFFWNFYSPYNILMLDDQYQYSLVSSGDDYLWILSRTPSLNKDILKEILTEAENRGFDTTKLIFVEQDV